MDLSAICVYKCPTKKERIGRDNDGGYIMATGFEYDFFISCGISDDISFETNILEKYPDLYCYAFDGTIEKCPEIKETLKDRFIFIKKNISYQNNEKETNLHKYLTKYKKILIKMDIEGYEFHWLNSLNETHLKNIKQFIVEFHHPIQNLTNWNLILKLKKTHSLIHLHPHNGCNYVDVQVNINNNMEIINIPNVFECTYIVKDFLELSDEPVPSKIDQKNSKDYPELSLYGYPYNTLKNPNDKQQHVPLFNIKSDLKN